MIAALQQFKRSSWLLKTDYIEKDLANVKNLFILQRIVRVN